VQFNHPAPGYVVDVFTLLPNDDSLYDAMNRTNANKQPIQDQETVS
jgi:hypothetical protein